MIERKRHIYHYCAIVQTVPGAISYIDGVALLIQKVESMSDYRALKEAIANGKDLKDVNFPVDRLIISSLSYLGECSE